MFDFKIFGLKYVLKHFESIPTKKVFDQIFYFVIFTQNDQNSDKMAKSKILGRKFLVWSVSDQTHEVGLEQGWSGGGMD